MQVQLLRTWGASLLRRFWGVCSGSCFHIHVQIDRYVHACYGAPTAALGAIAAVDGGLWHHYHHDSVL